MEDSTAFTKKIYIYHLSSDNEELKQQFFDDLSLHYHTWMDSRIVFFYSLIIIYLFIKKSSVKKRRYFKIFVDNLMKSNSEFLLYPMIDDTYIFFVKAIEFSVESVPLIMISRFDKGFEWS